MILEEVLKLTDMWRGHKLIAKCLNERDYQTKEAGLKEECIYDI